MRQIKRKVQEFTRRGSCSIQAKVSMCSGSCGMVKYARRSDVLHPGDFPALVEWAAVACSKRSEEHRQFGSHNRLHEIFQRCCQGANHLGFELLLVGTTSHCRPCQVKRLLLGCYPRERYLSAGQRAMLVCWSAPSRGGESLCCNSSLLRAFEFEGGSEIAPVPEHVNHL